MDLRKLLPYRRGVRPAQPDSFPLFLDTELARVARNSEDVLQALKDLDARLTAGHL